MRYSVSNHFEHSEEVAKLSKQDIKVHDISLSEAVYMQFSMV